MPNYVWDRGDGRRGLQITNNMSQEGYARPTMTRGEKWGFEHVDGADPERGHPQAREALTEILTEQLARARAENEALVAELSQLRDGIMAISIFVNMIGRLR